MALRTMISKSRRDHIFRQFAQYRATPLVWVNDEDHSSEILFGFYKDFSIVINYDSINDCEIEIEGLT